MPDFRYAQFCPLARAAEVVGERWTLLVVRELLLGPKRFSDFKRALPGVSPSILSDRLAKLEERGVVERRDCPRPTPASLYELTEVGQQLTPAMMALARWGAGLLGMPQPGDHFEAGWLHLGFIAFAGKQATPRRTFSVCVDGAEAEAFHVAGGKDGTTVKAGTAPADAALRVASPVALFAVASGQITPADALNSGAVRLDGDAAAFDEFPELFDMTPES